MATTRKIIISSNPKGEFRGGYLKSGVNNLQPGTILQSDPTVALVGGNFSYEPYNRSGDGAKPKGPIWILLDDPLQGKGVDDEFDEGEYVHLYSPRPGEEFNLRVKDTEGTGDSHTAGTVFTIDDGTGTLQESTGTATIEPFLLKEDIDEPADTVLAWFEYSGY